MYILWSHAGCGACRAGARDAAEFAKALYSNTKSSIAGKQSHYKTFGMTRLRGAWGGSGRDLGLCACVCVYAMSACPPALAERRAAKT
jgi:hypothetical protein